MDVGDKVVLKTEKIREIKDPYVRSMYAGEGIITHNFCSGYFSVRFENKKTGDCLNGGAYGSDLIVVAKHVS